MTQPFRKPSEDEILDAEQVGFVLDRLAELMHQSSSPTMRAILFDAADQIAELFNEDSDEDTELDQDCMAA